LITKTANDTKEYEEQRNEEIKRINLITSSIHGKIEIPPVDSHFRLENRRIEKYTQWSIMEFFILFVRFSINNLRDRMFTFVRLLQAAIMSVLIGLIYLQAKSNQKSIQDRAGAVFFCSSQSNNGNFI